jgi:predicted AAA+ superfamily ATPase
MKRRVSKSLLKWKNSSRRMPLIINGARQVGKTYIVELFGEEHYESVLSLNMEIEATLCKFLETELSPKKIVQYLEATKMQEIVPGKTLIFIDEIQVCERALTSLKYFCEQMPEHHIVAAGSLLGVAINREKYSFPVGKVNEINMYPLDFEEFLWAMNMERLAEEIKSHYTSNEAMPEALHKVALDIYQKYFIVGGMPAAVATFIETESYLKIQPIQNEILNEYIADMVKYADPATSIKIRACTTQSRLN